MKPKLNHLVNPEPLNTKGRLIFEELSQLSMKIGGHISNGFPVVSYNDRS